MPAFVLLRGGGDLASGVVLRLHRAGLKIAVTELPEPLAVRRSVAFAQAIYAGRIDVEGVTGRRVDSIPALLACFAQDEIPVLADPHMQTVFQAESHGWHIPVVVDGRLTKRPPETDRSLAPLVIGLGPGFTAGLDCHAVIETNRGHTLGRVYWQGTSLPDTATPEGDPRRVLRAPREGKFVARVEIAQHIEGGQAIAEVAGEAIVAPFKGVVRGLIQSGLPVTKGVKVGDIDPRDDPAYCQLVSDKALAIGGGVLEAILSRSNLRAPLWA